MEFRTRSRDAALRVFSRYGPKICGGANDIIRAFELLDIRVSGTATAPEFEYVFQDDHGGTAARVATEPVRDRDLRRLPDSRRRLRKAEAKAVRRQLQGSFFPNP
jgi:hypothetical protein